MLSRIGYIGEKKSLCNVTRGKMSLTWSYFFDTIIRCLTGKIGGWDQVTIFTLIIGYRLIRNKPINFGELILKEPCSKIESENLIYP